jgi:hypothetical protein
MAQNFMTGFAEAFNRARERTEENKREDKKLKEAREYDAQKTKEAYAHEETLYARNQAAQDARDEKQRGFALSDQAAAWKHSDEQAKITRDAELANNQFSVGWQALGKYADKRKEKQDQENEWANQAKTLAKGDSELANSLLPEIRVRGVATVAKELDAGYYQKDLNYKPSTKKVVMPMAVTNPQSAIDAASPARAEQAPKHTDLLSGMDLMPGVKQRLVAANQLAGGGITDYEEPTVDTSNMNLAYKRVPTNVTEVGDLGQAYFDRQNAIDTKNADALRKADTKIAAIRTAKVTEAAIKAEAEGTGGQIYFQETPEGVKQFFGVRDEHGIRDTTSDPAGRPQYITGKPPVPMDKEDLKYYQGLVTQYSKDSTLYRAKVVNFSQALNSATQMAQILHDDPRAASMVNNGLGTVKDLKGEAQALFAAVDDFQKQIATTNPEKDPGKYEQLVLQQKEAAEKFFSSTSIGAENDQSAINAAKFNVLKMTTANQLAQSMSTDNRVSNADYDKAMKLVSQGRTDDQILPTLKIMVADGYNKLKAENTMLSKNDAVTEFETRKGIKTGLRPERVEQSIVDLYGENSPQTAYLKDLNNNIAKASMPQGMPTPVAQPVAPEIQHVDFSSIPKDQQEGALKELKASPTPEAKKMFDEAFGPGAADKALKGGI